MCLSAGSVETGEWEHSGRKRCVLMHKVLASVAAWIAATHKHTQLSLKALEAVHTEQFESCAGTKSRTRDIDESFCRRRHSELLSIKSRLGINELSIVALSRLHAWAG